jgi:hypothetical protein
VAGKGESVHRYLVGVFVLACASMLAIANDRPAAKDGAKPPSMRFDWRMEGPAEQCGTRCRVWLSATGVITESTARDFDAFAKDNNVRGATVVLDSEGGSVLAALALGRAFRRLELTTTVGRTTLLGSADGAAPRARLSPKATCESMCAFILLGGVNRYVPPEARVLVHQIWLGSKSKRALESTYSAEELGLVQRDIGSIARYTVEMGGGIELLETALRVPPWEPMHLLTGEELRRVGLNTVERLFVLEVPVAAAPAPAPAPGATGLAASAHAQLKD